MAGEGMVTLVGAGPGDPGLMTLAGLAALREADVVLHDRLVGEDILAFIPPRATRMDVGKNKGSHPIPQEEINALLLRHVREGKRVVRLKGGDPYLFGRGGEEAEALCAAGVAVRVVPGVSSALAVPARAGIPLTHRKHASSVHIVAGHGRDGRPPEIDYRSLVRVGGTLVFLMGLTSLADILRGLLDAGMDGETPAAAVENGTRPEQRRILSTLRDLPGRVAEEGFASPAVVVVGDVCSLAECLEPPRRLPLAGRTVLAVSSRLASDRLASGLRELGCRVERFFGVDPVPLPVPGDFRETVVSSDWIVLTSPYGAELFFRRLGENGIDCRRLAGAKFAAVGPRTAAVLERFGVFADYVPDVFTSAALAAGLARLTGGGGRVLLFRARDGSAVLGEVLSGTGAEVIPVPAYATGTRREISAATVEGLRTGCFDAVAFTSASAVAAFAEAMAGTAFDAPTAFCIGEVTAAAAGARGMQTSIGPEATIEALVGHIAESLGCGTPS